MKYKMYLKVISVILVCALVLQSIPISVAAQTQDIAEQTTEEASAYVIGEDISKREMSVKHFRMSDGSYTAAVYPYPVHYENEQGELLDIDNSLYDKTDEADNVLSNVQNGFSVKFMKKSNPNKLYTLDKNGYKIKVAIEGAQKVSLRKTESQKCISNLEDFALANIGSKVIYEDILENADIEYSLVSNELKENIVLKKETDFNSIVYTYHLNGSLEAKQTDSKSITIYDKDGNYVLELSAPVMWDAQGNYSDSLHLELLEVKNSKIRIKLYWNMPENAAYPVTIDPIMRLSADRTAIQDVHIVATNPDANYNVNNHLRVSHDRYTMIKFPMPELTSGDKIINAQLVLAPYGAFDSDPVYSNENSYSPPLYITTHKILRSWNEETATYSNVNPENNFYDSTVQSYRIVDGDDSYYTWDITRLVNEWIDGYSENYGLLLKYAYPTSDGSRFDAFFCSTNGRYLSASACPDIVYQYVNTSGIEDYYSYHTQSVGYAGTAYTNDFTGNLTLVNNVLTTGGTLSPINVSLVYNLSEIGNDTVPYGAGWKLNWAQKIDKSVTSNYDNTPYLKYTDSDGTDHYFKEDTSTSAWTDEINPDRKVYYIESSEDYRMTDSSGTNMHFTRNGSLDEWYLYKVEDIYGNYIEIMLDAYNYNRVLKITASSGSVVNFEYNDYGYLSDIVYADGEESKRIEIDYNNYMEDHNNGITDIIYADGTRAKYHYHEGTKNLSKAIDIDGQYIYYEYTNSYVPKVDEIAKYNRNGDCEASAEISYSVTSTTFEDTTYNRQYLYTFASNGTLKSVVDTTQNDGNGYGQYYEFNNGDTTEIEGMNRLTFISKTQKSTVNLLTNHSFENSGYVSFTAFDETVLSASGTFSSELSFIGSRSYKITRPQASDSSRAFGYFSAYLEGGKTYTLSAYVNTKDMISAEKGASVAVIGSEHIYESEYITDSKDSWQRLYVTFTPSLSENVNVGMSVSDATGSVYFDNIQLEIGGLSDYNILENAGLENSTDLNPDYWCEVAEHGKVTTADKISGSCSTSLIGTPNEYSQYRQLISIPNGKKGDAYVASAFAKATSAIEDSWNFSLLIRFMYDGERVNDCDVDFNKYTTEWQKVSVVAKAEQDYDQIQIWLLYYRNFNTAYFDNVQLIKDTFGTAYTYDDNGNLISTVDLQGKEEYTFKYDGNNQLIKETTLSGGKILYSYNSSKEQQLDLVTDGMGSTYYDYDEFGNATASATYSGELVDGAYYYIQSIYNSRFLTAVDLGYSYGKDGNIAKFEAASSQRWKINNNSDGSYNLSCECEPDKLLSLEFDSLYSEGDLILFAPGGRQYQKFDLVKKYGNVYSLVIYEAPEWAVDASESDSYINDAHFGEIQQFAFIPIQNSNTAENPAIISSATYSDNGEYMTSLTDSRGNTVSYEYNEDRGYITAETDVNGVDTNYSYYSNELLQRVSKGASSVNYSYTAFKELSSITSPSGTVYNFEYDASGRNTAVKIGTTTLSSYLYDSKGRLDTLTYGNGHSVKYGYDALGRQTSTTINNVLRSVINYDGALRVAQFNDLILGKTVKYEYDILDRAVGEKHIDNSTKLVYAQLMLRYDDTKNRLAGYDTTVKGTTYNIDYLYGENENSPEAVTGIKLNGTKILGYDYDSLNRLKTRTLNTTTPFITEYTYVAGRNKGSDTDNTALTTTLVKTVKNGNDTLEYTYDKTGNITSVAKNGTVTDSYEYDSLNQLTKHTMGSDVYEYTYDNGGNMLTMSKNGTVKKTFGYSSGQWKDQLTTWNGISAFTYDQIGNPLTWCGMTFTWTDGRKLASVRESGNYHTYTYDAQGQRIQKNVNGFDVDYYWLNGQLQREEGYDYSIDFRYDENGKLYGMRYNAGSIELDFYYVYNLQGDVIAILDDTGEIAAEYTYDAWGNILSKVDLYTGPVNVADENPFRYRGYYYDNESGLYYCNSRYYDPSAARFVNADGYVSTGQDIAGYNMFLYCGNNPVNRIDPTGTFWKEIRNSLKKAWNIATTWVNNTFGAGTTTVYVAKQETEIVPSVINKIVTIKTGTKESKTSSEKGNSSKPISAYAKGRKDNILLSSAGIKINIESFTLDISLGCDNIGISGSIKKLETTETFGVKADISQFKIGFESSSTVKWDESTDFTSYTNYSVSGWIIIAAYGYAKSGQSVSLPQKQLAF